MRSVSAFALLLLLLVSTASLHADGGGPDSAVARNESLALKTSVKDALDALGAPPAGYTKSDENYDLPTSMSVDAKTGNIWLSPTSATFTFRNGMSGEQLSQEYQKKMMDAQSKGDYAEVQRLSLEMQKNLGAVMGAEMSKIEVTIALNRDPYQTIDPEGVLWEAPGAIAIRTGEDGANTKLMLAFDPKGLADTQKVSIIQLGDSIQAPTRSKAAVRTIIVELTGPEAQVTEWAGHVDKGKMLALIHD